MEENQTINYDFDNIDDVLDFDNILSPIFSTYVDGEEEGKASSFEDDDDNKEKATGNGPFSISTHHDYDDDDVVYRNGSTGSPVCVSLFDQHQHHHYHRHEEVDWVNDLLDVTAIPSEVGDDDDDTKFGKNDSFVVAVVVVSAVSRII
jgi:hypothetical protein